jgi:hypothetical protein
MLGWFGRQEQRERDLKDGVDADLVLDNRKRFWLGLELMATGFALGLCSNWFHLKGWFKESLFWTAMALLIGGFVVMRWTSEESRFLRRPDPPKPPSLFGRD